MPILREVITRFKFDTDKRGVKRVNNSIRGMKRGISGLTKLFGVGLGVASVRSLFKVGNAVDRARFNLQRLGNVDVGRLETSFQGIQGAMENVRKGSGDVLKLRDFFSAGAGFFQMFGRGQEQTDQFLKTFEFAAKLSAITGENVNQIFQNVAQGIETGDFSFLQEVPGFTKKRIQTITDLLKVADPGEIGGDVARQNRLRKFLELSREASSRINKDLALVPETMLQANRTATQFADNMDKLAKTVSEKLVPVLTGLADTLANLNQFFGISQPPINRESRTARRRRTRRQPGETAEPEDRPSIIEAIKEIVLPKPAAPGETRGRNRSRTIPREKTEQRIRQIVPSEPRGRNRPQNINTTINNTYNINGTKEPTAVAAEVKRKFDETIQKAGRAIVPSEDR